LTPSGAPTPPMKTLQQPEPRTLSWIGLITNHSPVLAEKNPEFACNLCPILPV